MTGKSPNSEAARYIRLAESTPFVPIKSVAPPDDLEAHGLAEWNRVINEQIARSENAWLTADDLTTLWLYCNALDAYADYQRRAREFRRNREAIEKARADELILEGMGESGAKIKASHETMAIETTMSNLVSNRQSAVLSAKKACGLLPADRLRIVKNILAINVGNIKTPTPLRKRNQKVTDLLK